MTAKLWKLVLFWIFGQGRCGIFSFVFLIFAVFFFVVVMVGFVRQANTVSVVPGT